jgi:hypothetical protein
LKLIERDGRLLTVAARDRGEDLLQPVFRNGKILKRWSLAEIRQRADLAPAD